MQSQDTSPNYNDLDPSIVQLFLKLDSLSKKCLYLANDDMEIYVNQIQIRRILEVTYKYQVGPFLCSRCIYGIMCFKNVRKKHIATTTSQKTWLYSLYFKYSK